MVIHNGELHHRVFQAYSSGVLLLKKAKRFYMRSMKGIVVTMPVQSPWWLKLFVMDFIG